MAFTGKFTTVSSSLVWDGSKFISESLDTIVANRAADKNAQYLVLNNTASLNGERALALGPGLKSVDGGANGLFELSASFEAGPGIVLNNNGQNIEISSSLNVDASFVVLGGDPSMPNERVLTGGPGITIFDGGPGGQVVVSASLTAGTGVSVVDDNGDIVISADLGALDEVYANISGSFILATGADPLFPESRGLVGGNGIAVTDGLAQGDVEIEWLGVAGPGIAINYNGLFPEISASLEAGPGIVINENPTTGKYEISGSVSSFWDTDGLGQIRTDESVYIGPGTDYANDEIDNYTNPANFFVSGAAIFGNDLTVRGRLSVDEAAEFQSSLTVDGSFITNSAHFVDVTDVGFVDAGNYDVLDTDFIVAVETSTAVADESMTITIPTAQNIRGRRIKISDVGGNCSVGNLIITCENPADGINGETTWTLAIDYSSVELVCVEGPGAMWVVV